MDLFFSFFACSVFILIVLGLWSLDPRHSFTRFEGNLKRGLMIWTEPLSGETRQFLENLPSSLQFEQGFIRKDINEVLIAVKSSSWFSFQRRNRLPYVAYVNLSAPENQIELRVSFLTLIVMTISLMTILFIFANFFIISKGYLPIFFWLFLPIFLFGWIGSFIANHYQERRYLLNLLNQATKQQNNRNYGSERIKL